MLQVTWTRNAKLGRFTNFVNLLDMCAVSVPSAVYTHPEVTGGLLGNLRLSGQYLHDNSLLRLVSDCVQLHVVAPRAANG